MAVVLLISIRHCFITINMTNRIIDQEELLADLRAQVMKERANWNRLLIDKGHIIYDTKTDEWKLIKIPSAPRSFSFGAGVDTSPEPQSLTPQKDQNEKSKNRKK